METSTFRRYEATGGKIGHDWSNTSCLVLHTIGRKSGETRKFPLVYGRDGNNYLIVASKGGAPDDPGWYKNLLAHPDVKIQVWDKVGRCELDLVHVARAETPDRGVTWCPG